MAALAQRLKILRSDLQSLSERASKRDCRKYATDPVGYAREVLGVEPWETQREIARLLQTPPYRVLVKSSHSVGKTWTAAWLTSWWHDTFSPSVVITTAPTARDVRDLLWTEIRLQRRSAQLGGFRGTMAPELWAADDHFAKGFTAAKGESFQGRHRERMLFIMDEAVGISKIFWDTTRSMFQPNGTHGWLCLFNPTDPSSQAWQEEQAGGWHVVTMSALDHPNIPAQLRGERGPCPEAVSVQQFSDWVQDWFTPVSDSERDETIDIEWPIGSTQWHRPGPEGEARALGRWPSQGSYSVWSEGLWQKVTATRHKIATHWPVQIGCDVARFGDDRTAIHVRQGLCSIHHESHNGWDTAKTAHRLKELCDKYATARHTRYRVPVLVDAGGIGGGVIDQCGPYRFIEVNSCQEAHWPERYPNLRSELWFSAAELAKAGKVDVSRLGKKEQQSLSRQLMSVRYDLDPADRRVCERKEETKKRLKRSPDDADAFNLCWLVYRDRPETIVGNTNT